MLCPKCGSPCEPSAAACASCGAPLAGPGPPPVSMSPEVRKSGKAIWLVVVLAVAISVANAVRNFPAAWTRSKVTRARNEMRALGTMLQNYRSDAGQFPPGLIPYLTSPVGYTHTLAFMKDPFSSGTREIYRYHTDDSGEAWVLYSAGPDVEYDLKPSEYLLFSGVELWPETIPWQYDASNGTTSSGDIIWIQS